MAAGMGGDGHAVATRAELAAALARAHATRGRFQLLDIRLEPGQLSPSLARFAGAVKRLSMPTQVCHLALRLPMKSPT
jgi:indolepyruvate decarboxylase